MKGTKVQTLGAVACADYACQLIESLRDVKPAHAPKLTRLVR